MNALAQTYLQYLAARKSMGVAIEKALAGKRYLPDATVRELAIAHAQFYKCTPTQDSETKQWHFYDADGARNNSARVQWDRNVRPYHKATSSKRGGSRNKKETLTPVAKLLEAFESLSLREQREFVRSLPRVV